MGKNYRKVVSFYTRFFLKSIIIFSFMNWFPIKTCGLTSPCFSFCYWWYVHLPLVIRKNCLTIDQYKHNLSPLFFSWKNKSKVNTYQEQEEEIWREKKQKETEQESFKSFACGLKVSSRAKTERLLNNNKEEKNK